MKSSQQYFVSFTIEGSEEESSDRLISNVQDLLHAWVVKKERDFGRTNSELPPLSSFKQGGKWENNRLRRSFCATKSGRLDQDRMAWGIYYEHAFEESSAESVILDFVVAETSPHAVAVAVTLYFEGNGRMVLSPPAFVSELLRFGVRTYNSKCCSERFFDLVQHSVTHARDPDGISSVTFTELTPFLADDKRSETVVAICKGDLNELDSTHLKESMGKIRRTATNLSGKALFFLLDGKFSNCRVFQPKVTFIEGREIYFPALDWKRLERNLSKADPPPIEDGVPYTCAKLAESIEDSASPVSPASEDGGKESVLEPPPNPPEQIRERTPSQDVVDNCPDVDHPAPFSRLSRANERLVDALSSLVSTLSGMLGESVSRP